jgi:ProQ/FINO family
MSKRKSGPTVSLLELAARFQAAAVPSPSLATKPMEDEPVVPATPPEPPAKKPKRLSPSQQRQRRLWSEHRPAAEGLIRTLRERYPGCFSDPPRPLALGISFAIAAEFPDLSAEVIKTAMTLWTRRIYYRQVVARGGPRMGLDGLGAGVVTDDEKNHAREFIAKWSGRKKDNQA